MIPQTLDEWTLPVLTSLLDGHYSEPETFDFKEWKITSKSDKESRSIRTDCCAFANGDGGFLVYGVADDTALSTADRLVGVPTNVDFPADFSGYPQQCTPSIRWTYKNPPIALPNNTVVHVVHIPKSWRGPHTFGPADGGFKFPKRTSGGNAYMSYDEVRLLFLGYYEKRLRLRLLCTELEHIIMTAQAMIMDEKREGTDLSLFTFALDVVESVVADSYTILAEHTSIIAALAELRKMCRLVNTKIMAMTSVIHLPLSDKTEMTRQHNRFIKEKCEAIIQQAMHALPRLRDILSE